VIIPELVLLIVGLMILSRTRLGRALASRISTGTGADTVARLEALQEELAGLRAQLSETQERLDFAERVLTRAENERLAER
jgi:hypothetical protein